jgi:hypothetical protein
MARDTPEKKDMPCVFVESVEKRVCGETIGTKLEVGRRGVERHAAYIPISDG